MQSSNIMRHLKLNREKASRWGKRSAKVRLEKALSLPPPDYPVPREEGFIVKSINGKTVKVRLIPCGRCDQWEAIFEDGKTIVGGMAKIDSEIRKRMPPRLSEYAL
jgi:hypothetical protein